MEVNAYVLNLASEEAIAPRQSMVGWLMSKINGAKMPSHVLGLTKVALDAEAQAV